MIRRGLALWIPCWIVAGLWNSGVSGAADSPALSTVTIYEWVDPNGRQHLGDSVGLRAAGKRPEEAEPLFQALPAEHWWPGMVPLFLIEKDGTPTLRRMPLKGQENLVEPLCFVVPAAGDTNAIRLAGHWHCTATRAGADDAWFAWQLTTEEQRVVGRFDPHSEYRVAYFKGGTLQGDRLRLAVEYSSASYVLQGEWRDGKLVGTWSGIEPEEHGRWEATRPSPPPMLPADALVSLFEWRGPQPGGHDRRYATLQPGPGWTASPLPLGRVWLLPRTAKTPGEIGQPDRSATVTPRP